MKIFYKISNGTAPSYLSDCVRSIINPSLRSRKTIPPFPRTERYDNSFFPFCIYNWNNLDDKIKTLPSLTRFKKDITSFVRAKRATFYGIRDNFRIKLLTKIRVGFSDLGDH